MIPPDALFPFMDEIKKHGKQKKQLAKKLFTLQYYVVLIGLNIILGNGLKKEIVRLPFHVISMYAGSVALNCYHFLRKLDEQKEKVSAEAAAAAHSMPILANFEHSSRDYFPKFSIDDFEALGSSSTMSSSPPTSSSPPVVGERILFPNVARLGFAAGRDSPSLKIEETSALHKKQQRDK
ncbi:hypothetical protein GH714_029473 [Hevea brasiliensis]|uniref:Uncharacterized protein n=1 Tax=Hevea brasiliensis TaxID=3981 RepID=A0A6A6LK45_HEVBR|nr:hypothetical protein GH714_029368 [Hevea brasiliensis]KAF2301806.1 hypothetical protein GH714_029473 [Hevea brasiliensis]